MEPLIPTYCIGQLLHYLLAIHSCSTVSLAGYCGQLWPLTIALMPPTLIIRLLVLLLGVFRSGQTFMTVDDSQRREHAYLEIHHNRAAYSHINFSC